MEVASGRSPILMEHTLYIQVKEFNNLLLCLVSLYLETTWSNYNFCTKFIEQIKWLGSWVLHSILCVVIQSNPYYTAILREMDSGRLKALIGALINGRLIGIQLYYGCNSVADALLCYIFKKRIY